VPLAYPEDPVAPGPWIVSNGTNILCIVGIGDQNALTDACGYMARAVTLTRRRSHVASTRPIAKA